MNSIVAIPVAAAAPAPAPAIPSLDVGPRRTNPRTAADPILAAIKEHKAAARRYSKAVSIEFGFEKDNVCVRDMDPEMRREYDALEAATATAANELDDAGTELVSRLPTTLAGLVAVCRYMAPLLEKDGACQLPLDVHFSDFETAFAAFCRTVADAIEQMNTSTSAT